MASYDPHRDGRTRPVVPQTQPIAPGAPPDAGPRAIPQAQPISPGRGGPRTPPASTPPTPAAQPVAPGQAVPQARPISPGAGGSAAPRPVPVGAAGSGVPVRARDPDEEPERDIASAAAKSAPPWLISAAFHMLLLIILGLVVVAMGPAEPISLDVVADQDDIWAEKLGEQLKFDSPLVDEFADSLEEPMQTPEDLVEVEDPFAAPPDMEIQPDGNSSVSDLQAKLIGMALKGREEGTRNRLVRQYGGTRLTEEAVLNGLEWLARQQRGDGHWSLSGPYSGGVVDDQDNRQAATAMALLAFQGHGETHKNTKGKYRKNVAEGWKWLLAEQDANGNFYHEGPTNHRFYTQGQCTIALCELYGMTKDEDLKEPATRALKYILDSQSDEGGWRYTPNSDSDVSVTGWIVMALQSARMAGLEVPEDHFRRIERFLDRVAIDDGAKYPYQRGGEARLSMTAEGLLCRQYLGWPRDDPRLVRGVEWITSENNRISFTNNRDAYYWYYATQVAHHMEGEYWTRWNDIMRQAMPEQQVKTGREAGSWDPERPTMDQWAPHAGRLYVTCLSIYMLEVYYRHLPIYTHLYSDLFKSGRTPGL